MPYNQNQLNLIQRVREDLRFLPSNTDILVMEFLRIYDVNCQPTDVGNWNGWDTISALDSFLNISRGGSSVASSIFYAGRSIQTTQGTKQKAEDWTTWKKWALDHKDFGEFRAKRSKEIEVYNNNLLEKINSKELKEELDKVVIEAQVENGVMSFYKYFKWVLYVLGVNYVGQNWWYVNGGQDDLQWTGILNILIGWFAIEKGIPWICIGLGIGISKGTIK